MRSYRHKYGDRPLEGYTIERGIGFGGFGEVYHAVSDGGRHVAIKCIQGFEDIELRGIKQCMNLKHPNLVTIFDVKQNAEGTPFVIMEYMTGTSLRDLLDDSPNGLGIEKASLFLRELAKGVSYLHDAGIVHRDLKPSNIFYEHGVVKIGDYGLSKRVDGRGCEGQTVTVGTLSYMAPEIGSGTYNRGVDVYSLGVLLYEMLKGVVPFQGESYGEVLMKHMSAKADLSGIPAPFDRVIEKALEKDPARRFQTVPEMLEAAFGAEYVRGDVSQYAGGDLSTVAGRVARRTGIASPDKRGSPAVPRAAMNSSPRTATADTPPKLPPSAAAPDRITARQRHVLAMITSCGVAFAAGILGQSAAGIRPDGGAFLFHACLTYGAAVAIWLATRIWYRNCEREAPPLGHFAAGGPACLLIGAVVTLTAWGEGIALQLCGSLCLPILLADWWKTTSPLRRKRLSLGRAIGLTVLGGIASEVLGADTVLVMSLLGGLSLSAQVLCPVQSPGPSDTGGSRTRATNTDNGSHQAYGPERDSGRAGIRRGTSTGGVPPNEPISPCGRLLSLLLCAAGAIGIAGLHRFYVGKIATGILWFCTWGLLGVGQLVDLAMIAAGAFRDKQGRRVWMWQDGWK